VVADGCTRFENGRWSMPAEGRTRPGEYVANFVGFWREGGVRGLESGGAFVDYTLPPEAKIKALSLVRDPPRGLLARAGPDRFLRLAGGSITSMQAPSAAALGSDPSRYGVVEGRSKKTWILDRGMLSAREAGAWRTFADPAPVTLPPPSVVFEDREGSL